ncbi:MAG: CHAD domain-containing protein [Gemmatimonadota bacterium]
MDVPREIELKLAVAAKDLPRLRRRLSRFGAPQVKTLENIYYDTKDFALAGHGMALRVRRIGRRWLQTLKTDNTATALSRRGEWEMPAPRGRLDVARFAGTPLDALLRKRPALKIGPRFQTRFERTLWTTREGAIEIALDEGEISAADRAAPIRELELELKAGDRAALWKLALDLVGPGAAAIALLPFGESKAARGVRLALNESVKPEKASAKAFTSSLRPSTTAGAALHSIIATGAGILLANVHGMRASDDPEFIHQARVAVRRMRSTVRLFRGEVEFPPGLDAELRWAGRALGRARDWDVFVLHTVPAYLDGLSDPDPSLERAARLRLRARDDAGAALDSARFAVLALQLLRWSDGPPNDGSPTLRSLVARLMPRAHRKLFTAAQRFEHLDQRRRHRVRILVKRLRYALDLMGCCMPKKRADPYARTLAQLQDELGALNDIVVGREFIAECESAAGALAEMRRRLRGAEREHIRAADRLARSLARAAPPWAIARSD